MIAEHLTRSIEDQAAAVGNGDVTAEELASAVRGQIEGAESRIAAWVHLSTETMNEARERDQDRDRDRDNGALPLRGISVGVKDLIDVAGIPTRAGSSTTSADPVLADAPCVARLRELGAVVQGKTVTTEFGYFAPGPTRNPFAIDHTPGGSSSGSAAAVGAGTLPLALGTQTAGSLTRPASFCGAAGMVFAHGTTDLAGVCGLSESLDSLGMLTRTVSDLAYVYSSFTGRELQPSSTDSINTVFVWDGTALGDIEPPMARLIEQVPTLLREAGRATERLEWDDQVRELARDHLTVMAHEAAITLDAVYNQHSRTLSDPLRQLIDDGRNTSEGDRDAALDRRERARAQLVDRMGRSIIVGPAALGPAPAGLAATGSPVLSRPWQLLGAPVVTVPGARTVAGLPLGLQLIGHPGHEGELFDVAIALEAVLRALPPVQD
ncbi:Asp-tRNA(Asn)/Glu-tRNA(Gln) amidotransferase A subunit family amidase [Williamsia muralis]|uniref:amidase n=1 Tax=Williamsia marianensis TaxID=85044 RepID=A0A495K8G2_WILMA|nr:Asp-tRNA(Asn)/Glu-tRNA(Gln) amidotransferase A subunit family amidase [Williamsia muralis]